MGQIMTGLLQRIGVHRQPPAVFLCGPAANVPRTIVSALKEKGLYNSISSLAYVLATDGKFADRLISSLDQTGKDSPLRARPSEMVDLAIRHTSVYAERIGVDPRFLLDPVCQDFFFSRIGISSQITYRGRLITLHKAALNILGYFNITPKKVVDIGIGALSLDKDAIAVTTRELAVLLMERFPSAELIGVDVNVDSVKDNSRYALSNLSYLAGDVTKQIPVPEHSVDLVYCSNVFCHLKDEAKKLAADNIASILTIGRGIAVIGDGDVGLDGSGMERYFAFRTMDGNNLKNLGDIKSLQGL